MYRLVFVYSFVGVVQARVEFIAYLYIWYDWQNRFHNMVTKFN